MPIPVRPRTSSYCRVILLLLPLALTAALPGCTRTPQQLEARGDELLSEGRFGQAMAAYKKAVELSPEDLGLKLKVAGAYRDRGLRSEAIERYETILEEHPESLEARRELALLLAAEGLRTRAMEQIGILKDRMPGSPVPWKLEARMAQQDEDWRDAVTHWRQALRRDDQDAEAYHMMGRAHMELGDYPSALAALQQAVRVEEGYDDAYFELGLTLIELNRIDRAEEAYRNYIDTHPRDAQAYYKLGNALLSKGYAEQAVEQYRRAVAIRPGYADAHFNLGMALLQQDREEEAAKAFEAVLIHAARDAVKDNARSMLRVIRQGGREVPEDGVNRLDPLLSRT
ncbi:MAG: tetratricopeptide repeat protein [bacterium]